VRGPPSGSRQRSRLCFAQRMTDGDSDNQRETRVPLCADELVGSDAVDIDVVAVAGALATRLAAVVPEELTVTVQAETVYVMSDRGNGSATDIASALNLRGSLAERLRAASERALDCASEVIAEETTAPWPARAGEPFAGAEVIGGAIRLWYGDRDAPFLELPPIPLNEVRRPSKSVYDEADPRCAGQ
jgi:hypothetical protein